MTFRRTTHETLPHEVDDLDRDRRRRADLRLCFRRRDFGNLAVIGPIAQFGSIVVDGITFDITDAVVTIEGNAATVDDLKLGMYVFVRGPVDETTSTGVAERVASDHVSKAQSMRSTSPTARSLR